MIRESLFPCIFFAHHVSLVVFVTKMDTLNAIDRVFNTIAAIVIFVVAFLVGWAKISEEERHTMCVYSSHACTFLDLLCPSPFVLFEIPSYLVRDQLRSCL